MNIGGKKAKKFFFNFLSKGVICTSLEIKRRVPDLQGFLLLSRLFSDYVKDLLNIGAAWYNSQQGPPSCHQHGLATSAMCTIVCRHWPYSERCLCTNHHIVVIAKPADTLSVHSGDSLLLALAPVLAVRTVAYVDCPAAAAACCRISW